MLPLLGLHCAAAPPSATTATAAAAASATTAAAPQGETPQARPGRLRVSFSLPDGQAATPFVRPWPSELARRADGRVDIRRFPGHDHFALTDMFAELAPQLTGFSTRPVIYFRFGPGDHDDSDAAVIAANATLKALFQQLPAALKAGAIVLRDVDPHSPERGRSFALRWRYLDGVPYVPSHTLALRPLEALRPNTLYLATVLRRWRDGWPQLGTNLAFEQLKSRGPLADAAHEGARVKHQQALDWLETHGTQRQDLAALALFRTQAVGRPLRAMLDAVANLPTQHAPKLLSLETAAGFHQSTYWAYRGYYCTPNFQTGLRHAPFIQQGGAIITGEDGRARVQPVPSDHARHAPECAGALRARFSLAVPKGVPPKAGWPLMVYAHGTTGDAFSALGTNGFASAAARAGVATVSTDQPLHGGADAKGARPGSLTPFQLKFGRLPVPISMSGRGGELAFFNGLRPPIMRDNIRQATADSAALARLVLHHDFAAMPAPAAPDANSAPASHTLRFNRTFGYIAAGHSQGSYTALPLGAYDPLVTGVLASAAGGDMIASAFKTKDSKQMLRIVSLVMGLGGADFDAFHPIATLVQTALDPIDPQNHAAALRRGMAPSPRSVLLINGKNDTMTVHSAAEALALSLRATPLGQLAQPMPQLNAFGLLAQPQVAANGNDGASTFALLYLHPTGSANGHYVAFTQSAARKQMVHFLRQLASSKRAPRLIR